MFDAAAGFGGAGKAPERQGFAVFRKHSWFDDLVTGTPTNQDQARAMRQFLYTWVHEAGHAFNLLHSWNKSRPSSLSWMNYDWKYDQLNGEDAFWADFRFRFDDEELIHIRHGDRARSSWAGTRGRPAVTSRARGEPRIESEPDRQVELLVRAKSHFEFLEPVEIEFRLRNTTSTPVPWTPGWTRSTAPRRSSCSGRTAAASSSTRSSACTAMPEMIELAPAAIERAAEGPDRVSALVPLMYGVGGFTFATPGTYLVRAVYQGAGMLRRPTPCGSPVGFPTDKAHGPVRLRVLHARGRPDHGARRVEVAVPRDRAGHACRGSRPVRGRSGRHQGGAASWPGRSATTSTVPRTAR